MLEGKGGRKAGSALGKKGQGGVEEKAASATFSFLDSQEAGAKKRREGENVGRAPGTARAMPHRRGPQTGGGGGGGDSVSERRGNSSPKDRLGLCGTQTILGRRFSYKGNAGKDCIPRREYTMGHSPIRGGAVGGKRGKRRRFVPKSSQAGRQQGGIEL